jgi:hypothetical protein
VNPFVQAYSEAVTGGYPTLVGKPRFDSGGGVLYVKFYQPGTNWSDSKHPAEVGLRLSGTTPEWGPVMWEEVRSRLDPRHGSWLLDAIGPETVKKYQAMVDKK